MAAGAERAPRGLAWKQGRAGLYWAHVGPHAEAWAERVDARTWRVRLITSGGRRLREATAPSLARAKAWAEAAWRDVA